MYNKLSYNNPKPFLNGGIGRDEKSITKVYIYVSGEVLVVKDIK
jgi:hypothetical protein